MEPIFKDTLAKRGNTRIFVSTYLMFEGGTYSIYILPEGQTSTYSFEFPGLHIELGLTQKKAALDAASKIHYDTVEANKNNPTLDVYMDYMESASLDIDEPMLEGDILQQMLSNTIFGRN